MQRMHLYFETDSNNFKTLKAVSYFYNTGWQNELICSYFQDPTCFALLSLIYPFNGSYMKYLTE